MAQRFAPKFFRNRVGGGVKAFQKHRSLAGILFDKKIQFVLKGKGHPGSQTKQGQTDQNKEDQ